jgi:hypothetical protein
MDKETWILPEEALEYGFATGIEKTENKAASQSAKKSLLDIIKQARKTDTQEADEENPDEEEAEEEPTDDAEGEEQPEDDPAEEPEEEPEEEDPAEKAEQRFSGFFNAILKM